MPLRWRFPDAAAMTKFVRLLFGVDRASDATLRAAIEDLLGTEVPPEGGIALRWELLAATGRKAG